MKEDEKTKLIQDYEQVVSSLNTELTYMKSQQSLSDNIPNVDNANVLQEENDLLHQEIKSYKNIKINLEQQIKKLKIERNNQKDQVSKKIVELEESKTELLEKINKQDIEINRFNEVRKEFEEIIDELNTGLEQSQQRVKEI